MLITKTMATTNPGWRAGGSKRLFYYWVVFYDQYCSSSEYAVQGRCSVVRWQESRRLRQRVAATHAELWSPLLHHRMPDIDSCLGTDNVEAVSLSFFDLFLSFYRRWKNPLRLHSSHSMLTWKASSSTAILLNS